MPTTVSDYFTDELLEWNESIDFHMDEIEALTHKLGEVIRRNSIIGISEKVEAHQIRINQAGKKFYSLQKEIHQQEAAFKTESVLIDDTLIRQEAAKHQVELRVKMQAVEKEYIDVKFDCYHFLAEVLKK